MSSIGSNIFAALVWPLQRLPMGFHRFWGNVFAFVTEHIIHYRRDVVMINIARSFPEKKYKELGELVHGYYKHIGDIFTETMWFGGCRGNVERLRKQNLCVFKGVGPVSEAYSEGRSSMILMSHLGNWEIVSGLFYYFEPGSLVTFSDKDIVIVYKKQTSKTFDDFFRRNRLTVMSPECQYKESREILRYTITNRNVPKVYFSPTDQYPYSFATKHEIPDFMHQPTVAMTGGAALACKFGMPVFYFSHVRTGKNQYEGRFIKLCDNASEMTPEEVMARFYAHLEVDVNNDPTNYLWSHKRWK